MSRTHLTETDLRLFLVLDVLLAEGSVTRAAARLGQTQSAVSHSLRQLREHYGDALLVRGRGGMMPTPLALQLVPSLRLGLTELERVLNRDLSFNPAHSTRLFSLATPDYPHVTGLPLLISRLRQEAPGVDVRVRPIRAGMVEDLASGRTRYRARGRRGGAVPRVRDRSHADPDHLRAARLHPAPRPSRPVARIGPGDIPGASARPHQYVGRRERNS